MDPSPDRVHPRPQLTRDGWEDLCGLWDFAYDDADVGVTAGWQRLLGADDDPFGRTITVPFPPESKLSGISDPSFHPVLWYRRVFVVDAPAEGSRLLLHFGAVDYAAQVWANGSLVGDHSGGHTPFSCDLTDVLRDGSDAGSDPRSLVIVVRAEDQPGDVGQPRGKQDWQLEPHSIWYHRTSGIWQPVWLETVPETHVVELQWTPDIAAGRVRAEVRLNRVPLRSLSLRIGMRIGEEVLAEHTLTVSEQLTTCDIVLPALSHQADRGRLLWRPGSPTLVDVRVELLEASAPDAAAGTPEVVDSVSSYFGLRSVGVDGGAFMLNGRRTYLRSVLAQGYWPESHLAAPDESALRREVELIKRLGFNGVRVHQKVEDPRFLYWCDRLGLMVWGEIANAFRFDATAAERLTGEWLEVLRRDRSHPCIVTWVPLNESWGIDDVATDHAQRSFAVALYSLTKAIDPSRPVIGNDGWEHVEGDIWGVHDYTQRGRGLRRRYGTEASLRRLLASGRVNNRKVMLPGAVERGQPVMLSEFGGVRFAAAAEHDGWGYSEVRSAEAFADRLQDLLTAVLASPGLAGFCYTQLTDTEQEQNGLLTAAREPKASWARLRKIFTAPVRAEPAVSGGPPDSGSDGRSAARSGLLGWVWRRRNG